MWHRFRSNAQAAMGSRQVSAVALRAAGYEETVRSNLSSSGPTMPTSADPQARQFKL
jgi:hypothetical protein